jgi:hypothetical protein
MLRRLIFLAVFLTCSNVSVAAGESALMPGEVIQGHAKLEENCKECHVRFNKEAQTGLCSDCHKDVKADIQKHEGFHGRLGGNKECRECHTEHKGRNAKIVLLDTKNFDHSKTDFPLLGAHLKPEKVKCADCHEAKKKYREAPSECNACHRKDDKHKGSLGTDCKSCHNERTWKETRFDHSLEKTRFALIGKHVDVKCSKCHVSQSQFKGVAHECVACHRKDDKHKGQYGKKCETCHTAKDWKKIEFDHDTQTKFKLLGKHELAKCVSCHKAPLFTKEKTPTTCVACHHKDDVHKGGLGDKCATCHNEEKWKAAKFNHDKDTKFPLSGKHVTTKCDACHKPELKAAAVKLATTCIGCHKKDDKHKDSFGAKCETCHKETDWKAIIFDHNRDTKYALKGKHGQVKCISCHTGNLYQQKLAQDCISCHTKDDVHKGKLGKRCESCHNEKEWKDARIDHGRARFPLLGLHVEVECKKCHQTKLFRDTPSDCYSCHKKDDDKIHKRRLGTKCETCHNARSWKAWDFDHDKRTKFKLDGGHKKLDCYACHKKAMEDRVVVSSTCVGCHDSDDVHRGEFGQLCERCHVTSDFKTLLIGSGTKHR